MTYIILKDTFGDGLETISNIGLEVIEDVQLDEYIIDAAKIIAQEDGYEDPKSYNDDHKDLPIEETLVICEIKETIWGHSESRPIPSCDVIVSDYIKGVIKKHMDKETKEQYALYLKLKEKFEKDTSQTVHHSRIRDGFLL